MARLLITWITNCVGLLIASAVISPISYSDKLGTLLLAGLVLAVVNLAVRPLVILLTLPAVILSLGIALLFINALMLWVTSKLVSGFHVGGFWSTVGGALIMWLVNMALRPWTSRIRPRTPPRSSRRRPPEPRARVRDPRGPPAPAMSTSDLPGTAERDLTRPRPESFYAA